MAQNSDPIMEKLLGTGGAFEVCEVTADAASIRIFKHAPDTLFELIDGARKFGPAEFIVEESKRLTFDDFFAEVERLAQFLKGDRGLGKGDVVAIAMKNRTEWMVSFCAIVATGAIPALINSRLLPEKLNEQVQDSGAKLLIADEARLSAHRSVGCELPSICADLTDAPNCQVISKIPASNSAIAPEYSQNPDDIACLFFTSGTTGRAKAAALTHRNLVTGIMNTQLARVAIMERMAGAYNLPVEQLEAKMPQPASLLVFPLFHTSGCSAIFLTMLVAGGKLAILPKWNPNEALRTIEAEKITAFASVPTMLWDILNCDGLKSYDLSSLSSFSTGGQALPLNLLNQLRTEFPGAFIGAGYGMTETSGSVSQATGEEYVAFPDSAGKVLPMVDLKIVDEKDKPCPVGTVGEICVKGAIVMKGYRGASGGLYDDRKNGWFATGDVGYVSEQGYLFIVDRKTDMIISGGENIYCAEVEQSFNRSEEVAEVVALGVPDDRLGEKLVVAVVLKEGSKSDLDALHHYAEENLAPYCRPSVIRIYAQTFPRNAMGKVNKAEMREIFLQS